MTQDYTPLLFAVGGAHMDRRGQSSVPFIPGASNPGIMREEPGGGVFNALRLAVRRGVRAEMLSVRGGDRVGDVIGAAFEAAGITDSSAVFIDRATPSYTAILDEQGDVVAAIADMALYELALPRQLRRRKVRDSIEAADAVFGDANLPSEALQKLAELAGGKPLYALAISPAKAVRLRPVLGNLACLFLNRREAFALTGLGADASLPALHRALMAEGLQAAVVSNGGQAALAYSSAGAFSLLPPELSGIADVTGAGDALAGGTISALMRGLPLTDAVREGFAASALTLQTHSATPVFTSRIFDAALAAIPAAMPLA
ncbi:carbohydrate kinase family protein [Phyllobacterium sp. 22229]|uniref:Carbohydrate kinase n=1 Tax=Phyllobacterium myrsinacearum TaxID=28101 RepID=A0A2S9JXY5_9HYPH|nr:carbohydrate kinase family protein [Phyllobacterium myrsinacearum]PRD58186.1 carbohydrate kinase [Phyllobacterium myrsinacearum]PWV96391.1 sugar/nucleoside kinase (ribokinase family) [Phyllobacterium myrsinacearum]RZV09619.1 sugar/nucleoside kinase (ribokinase family) [Phyllobacterium myrsinacearum]